MGLEDIVTEETRLTKKPTAKILLFDIETAPNLAYVWGKYEQNVIDYQHEWYMLTFAYKWYGEKKVHGRALPDYRGYKKGSMDDKKLVSELRDLFDEADIIVGHNGDQFDIKKSNARFLVHGLPPPSPYKTVDTKKVAKKYFNFNSNKLDDLGQHLGLGRKEKHEGFELWLGCMRGDPKSWAHMLKYNKQDVNLLESVYETMKPWMTNHPNLAAIAGKECACPNCEGGNLQRRGFNYTRTGKFQRYSCLDCGAWSSARRGEGPQTEVK